MNLEYLQIFGTLLAPQYADQHAQSVNEKFPRKYVPIVDLTCLDYEL